MTCKFKVHFTFPTFSKPYLTLFLTKFFYQNVLVSFFISLRKKLDINIDFFDWIFFPKNVYLTEMMGSPSFNSIKWLITNQLELYNLKHFVNMKLSRRKYWWWTILLFRVKVTFFSHFILNFQWTFLVAFLQSLPKDNLDWVIRLLN